MKKLLNGTLLTLLGLAAVSTAQAQYSSPDLILGFTGGNAGSDVLFDIGTSSQIGVGSTPGTITDLSSSLSLSLLNNNGYSSLAGKSLGVIGYQSGTSAGIYSTVAPGYTPNTVGNKSAFNGISLTIDDTGSLIDGTGSPANSSVASTSNPNSWNMNVANPGANTFYNDYGNPDITLTGGTDVANLYLAKDDASAPKEVGYFTLSPSEQLTFTSVGVPEPSTTALFAVSGLLAFAFRRHFSFRS
jgi:PEP-CTERM motif